jgi:hypothetical protein
MADRARRVDGSTDTEVRPAEQPAVEEPRTGRLRFPSAPTALALVLAAARRSSWSCWRMQEEDEGEDEGAT